MPPPKTNKEIQVFLGIIDNLSKLSPSIVDKCGSLRKLTSAKTEWTWNVTYKKIFYKAKPIIKEDACKKVFDETNPLYIETDTSGVGLEPLCYKQEVILAPQRMKLILTAECSWI